MKEEGESTILLLHQAINGLISPGMNLSSKKTSTLVLVFKNLLIKVNLRQP